MANNYALIVLRLTAMLVLPFALLSQAPTPAGQNGGYGLGVPGSKTTTVPAKLNSFYEAVADFGADPTGATDSTSASQAAITAALSAGSCAHFMGGHYLLSYSAVASLTFPSNSCLKGDGPNQTIFLETTPAATIMAVTGHNVYLKDFFMAMAPRVSAIAATGLSLYPDVTSAMVVSFTRVDNVSISSQWCNEAPANACGSAANLNRLRYGVLLQSGIEDDKFNWFTNLYVRWATEGVYLLSGGLAGSSGGGAVNANVFTAPFISDTEDCFLLGASGENSVKSGACTNARHAEVTMRSNPNGGTYASGVTSANNIEILGESSAAFADFGSSGGSNIISSPLSEVDGGSRGNYRVLGSNQYQNMILAPGNFNTGFYQISSITRGTYSSGGTITGSAAQTCLLSFPGGTGSATLSLTGNNVIGGGSPFSAITAAGTYRTAPTSATLSNGTAKCSGTAVVSSVLAVSDTSVDTFLTNRGDWVNSPSTATVDFAGSPHNSVFVRLRNYSRANFPNFDYYNLNVASGHIWTDDPASPLSVPIATFRKSLTLPDSAAPSVFVRIEADAGNRYLAGDVNFEFTGAGANSMTSFKPGVNNPSGNEVYPFGVQGNGVYQNNQAMTAASQLPACTSANVGAEVHNYPFATSNTFGASPGSGGVYNVAIRCGYNGSAYRWTIYAQ